MTESGLRLDIFSIDDMLCNDLFSFDICVKTHPQRSTEEYTGFTIDVGPSTCPYVCPYAHTHTCPPKYIFNCSNFELACSFPIYMRCSICTFINVLTFYRFSSNTIIIACFMVWWVVSLCCWHL